MAQAHQGAALLGSGSQLPPPLTHTPHIPPSQPAHPGGPPLWPLSWPAGATHSTDDAVSAALESVLYAQMLVLFAPQAVPARSHLPVLVRWGGGAPATAPWALPAGGCDAHTATQPGASQLTTSLPPCPPRSNLLSRQPRLRKAAADTLRHVAERDAAAVLAERVEPSLFAALDGETGGPPTLPGRTWGKGLCLGAD